MLTQNANRLIYNETIRDDVIIFSNNNNNTTNKYEETIECCDERLNDLKYDHNIWTEHRWFECEKMKMSIYMWYNVTTAKLKTLQTTTTMETMREKSFPAFLCPWLSLVLYSSDWFSQKQKISFSYENLNLMTISSLMSK